MPTEVERTADAEAHRRIRAPQNFIAGLTLVALAAFAAWATRDLPQGTLRAMGPAMLPRWLAIAVGLCGLALAATALIREGDALDRWSLRGPFFIVVATIAFALTIRQFGLAVAGPLAIIISGFASPETRIKENVIFGIVMTAFCVVLFRYLLNQPMPILIVPGTGIQI